MNRRVQSKPILRQRDQLILRLLYEYRFLDSELIWNLLTNDTPQPIVSYSTGGDGKARPTKYGFKRQALSKRLKQLYDAGYVERHYLTDQPWGRGYGSPRAIYGLGRQSPMVLQEFVGVSAGEVRRIVEGNKVRSPYLHHALQLAYFRVIMQLACSRSEGQVSLLFWEQGLAIRDHVLGLSGKGEQERFTIQADAFFGLRLSEGRNKHFFLEIDRGTEPIVSFSRRSNIRRKLIGYEYYRRSGRVSDRFPQSIHGFQVLIVTPGRLAASGSVSGRIANIIDELHSHRDIYRSSSLFLLTTLESLSLEEPESILSVKWVSLKSQGSLISLLE